ncbi:MAG: FeoB small GTPase domain-containing protein, partial [Anaerolineae bacterium]
MSTCHPVQKVTFLPTLQERPILVALAGQPNVGKSTLFNLLTGLHQHVGNWPGKTVERKEGYFTFNGASYRLVDLPGTYSLTANSPEELIAREFILRERPDVVVAVVDAATLERSLYLVAELLPLPAPVVVALNMMDVAQREGIQVEPEVLQAALGVPVIPMSATRGVGVPQLLETVERMARGELPYAPRLP